MHGSGVTRSNRIWLHHSGVFCKALNAVSSDFGQDSSTFCSPPGHIGEPKICLLEVERDGLAIPETPTDLTSTDES